MIKTRYAMIIFFIEVIAFTIFNIASSGTIGLFILPFMAMFGGWQMGVIVGWNDRDKKKTP